MPPLRQEDKLLAEAMGWEIYENAWFDKDGHYKEEGWLFSPYTDINDAFYVFERLDLGEISILKSKKLNKWMCHISNSENDRTSHFYGENDSLASSICDAILDYLEEKKNN